MDAEDLAKKLQDAAKWIGARVTICKPEPEDKPNQIRLNVEYHGGTYTVLISEDD